MTIHELMLVLVARRMALGMTQRNLAYRMNTSQGRVSDIECLAYIPRIATLERYADLVGMRLSLSLHDVE